MLIPLESITTFDYLTSRGWVIEVQADELYVNIYKEEKDNEFNGLPQAG